MARHGFQSPPAPAARPLSPTGSAPIATRAELPGPVVSDRVLVRTPQRIGGQFEHAAIVTKVPSGILINVLLMPDGEAPYSVSSIGYSEAPSGAGITWRWPPRI